MTLSERLIRYHEGWRARAYVCTAGKLTIGYGRNLEDRGITREEGDLLLANDLARVARELRTALPWTERLDPVREAALTDLCYQLGLPKLLLFKQTLRLLEHGEWTLAAKQVLRSRYAQQTPLRARRIAGMLQSGAVPSDLPE